ncbi:hypothetical protein BVRB_038290, partial [Beta vulgaris subsp. vulgaris]
NSATSIHIRMAPFQIAEFHVAMPFWDPFGRCRKHGFRSRLLHPYHQGIRACIYCRPVCVCSWTGLRLAGLSNLSYGLHRCSGRIGC